MTRQNRPKPVTIDKIAATVGVSRSTVSRAFTRPGLLSAETVARIHAAAQQLNYVPNQAARTLSTGLHQSIALIVSDIVNPFFPPLIRAAQSMADLRGFSVFLGDSDEDVKREEALLTKFAQQTAGVVLVSSRLAESRIREFAKHIPLVLVNRDIAGIPRVLIDTHEGITQAVQHLYELGHRHIVYIGGPKRSWSNTQRLKSVCEAGQALSVKVTLVDGERSSYPIGCELAPAIADSGASAVVVFDDLLAHGLLAGLNGMGVQVPQQMSVIGCDDALQVMTTPPLTTVSSRSEEAGGAAMRLLLDRLNDGETRDIRYVLDTRLVLRATVQPVSTADASPAVPMTAL